MIIVRFTPLQRFSSIVAQTHPHVHRKRKGSLIDTTEPFSREDSTLELRHINEMKNAEISVVCAKHTEGKTILTAKKSPAA